MGSGVRSVLFGWYRSRLGTPSRADEVYGYWLFILGVVLGLGGVGLFVYGTTVPRGEFYWLLRESGLSMAAVGLALVVFGNVVRLPLRSESTLLSVFGLLATTLGIMLFLQTYPSGWDLKGAGSRAVPVYLLGLAIIAVTGSFVPLMSKAREDDSAAVARPSTQFAIYEDVDGWKWRFYAADGRPIAHSDRQYQSRAAVRDAVAELTELAPSAGLEVDPNGGVQFLSDQTSVDGDPVAGDGGRDDDADAGAAGA